MAVALENVSNMKLSSWQWDQIPEFPPGSASLYVASVSLVRRGRGYGTAAVVSFRLGQLRVDSGRGQNRTLRPLSAFWPPVFAGEQDVSPSKGWDVGQELGLDRRAGVFPLSDRFAEMGGIPEIERFHADL